MRVSSVVRFAWDYPAGRGGVGWAGVAGGAAGWGRLGADRGCWGIGRVASELQTCGFLLR